jgi:hypothetical protein
LRDGAEKHFLKRVLTQVADVTKTFVILAVAGDGAVRVDGDVVFGLAVEGCAVVAASGQAGLPHAFPHHETSDQVADDPIPAVFGPESFIGVQQGCHSLKLPGGTRWASLFFVGARVLVKQAGV